MSGNPRVALFDPRIAAAEAPYTYFLPAPPILAVIGVGDCVKLVFKLIPPGERWTHERMWVEVTAIDGDAFTGRLSNIPSEAAMEPGEIVTFQRWHIIDTEWEDEARTLARLEQLVAQDPSLRGQKPARQYWERCLVDDCVLNANVPVEYLYRETPDMQEEGDEYPDSGWRIRGRRGDASDEEMEAREAQYVALGAVLNRDDSWLHLIDAPAGSAFMRDFENGTYRED